MGQDVIYLCHAIVRFTRLIRELSPARDNQVRIPHLPYSKAEWQVAVDQLNCGAYTLYISVFEYAINGNG